MGDANYQYIQGQILSYLQSKIAYFAVHSQLHHFGFYLSTHNLHNAIAMIIEKLQLGREDSS